MRATQVTPKQIFANWGDILFFNIEHVPNWVARTPAGHDIWG
jgi:hypothetical protein